MNNKTTTPSGVRGFNLIAPWAVLATSLIVPAAGAVAAALLIATLVLWPTKIWLKTAFSALAVINATVANLHNFGGPIPLPTEIIVVNATTVFLGVVAQRFLSQSQDRAKVAA